MSEIGNARSFVDFIRQRATDNYAWFFTQDGKYGLWLTGIITSIPRDTPDVRSCCCCFVVVVVSHIQRIGCQPEKTTLHGGQSRSWSAEQGKENKRKSLAAYPPPPTPHTARSEKINKITRRIYRRYEGGRSRVRTRIPSARRLGLWVWLRKILHSRLR